MKEEKDLDASRKQIWAPTCEEAGYALRIAASSKRMAVDIIEKGRPNAEDFMNLCADIQSLEGHIVGGLSIDERSEDLLDRPPRS